MSFLYSPYSTGTVSIANGSADLVGVGTAWATVRIVPGDRFDWAGLSVAIHEVVDDTHITLQYPWPGSTLSGSAYFIQKYGPSRYDASVTQVKAQDFLARLDDMTPTYIVADGEEPDVGIGNDGDVALQFSPGEWNSWVKESGVWVEQESVIAGAPGADGGISLAFNSATSGDPGAGKFLFNHATFASATAWHVSETDADANAIATFLAAIDNGAGANKALVYIKKEGAGAGFLFYITAALTDAGGYDTYPIVPIQSFGAVSNNNECGAIVVPLEKGGQGEPGTDGDDLDYDQIVADITARDAITTPVGVRVAVSDIGDGRSAIYELLDDSPQTWSDPLYSSGATNLVNDTTPQLGGDLDLNGHDIPVSPTQETFVRDSIEAAPDIRRNRIVNPCMQISQQNGSTQAATDAYYAADQWYIKRVHGATNLFFERVAIASPAGTPDRNYLLVTISGTDASIASTDYAVVLQDIEASRMADFLFGTSGALPGIIRIRMRSSIAGTFCVSINNPAFDRSFIAEVVISGGEAGTDVVKEVSFAGQTGGTWVTTDTKGWTLGICLMAGSNFQATAGWQTNTTSNKYATSNQTNLLGTDANTFRIYEVGLKMDVDGIGQYGAFEVPDLVQVLKECQRFYRKYGSGSTVYERLAVGVGLSTTQVNFIIDFNSSPMRSASYSGGLSNNSHFAGYDGSTLFTGTWALGDVAKGSCSLFLTTTGVTATNAYALVTNNTLDGYLFLNDRMS